MGQHFIMIPGGYYIKARQIKYSWVANAAPVVREIWDYLLREANHHDKKYNGFIVKRGQLFRSFREIRDDLKWKIGYRTIRYSENQTKHAMKLLRSYGMIELTNQPRGNLITVLNYDYFQNPKNYESTDESTDESTNNQPIINQSSLPINKNDKNVKNDKKHITRKIKKHFPDDFVLNDSLKTYATENGIDPKKVDLLFDSFKDYHIAKGTVLIEWNRAWHTWVRNAPQFSPWAMDKKKEKRPIEETDHLAASYRVLINRGEPAFYEYAEKNNMSDRDIEAVMGKMKATRDIKPILKSIGG